MARLTRRISWLKGARREFAAFPQGARDAALDALTVVAAGGMPGIAKPLKGFGSGVLELALRHRGEAYRVVYAVQIGAAVWVLHAFQKKAQATSKRDLDLAAARFKDLIRRVRQ